MRVLLAILFAAAGTGAIAQIHRGAHFSGALLVIVAAILLGALAHVARTR